MSRQTFNNILAFVFFIWAFLIGFDVIKPPSARTIAVAALLALAIGCANTAENLKIQSWFRDAVGKLKTALDKARV
jgi:hypothetical protein